MGTPGRRPSTTLGDALRVFDRLEDPGTPLAAAEVGEELGCTRRTAYRKLEELAERGELNSKKVGARGRVWWRPVERRRAGSAAEPGEILERVSDAFYALDEEWRFTYVNGRAEEIIERPAEEVLGNSLWEEFPEAAEGIVWEKYHEAMEAQEPVSFEFYYEPLGVWTEVNAHPSGTGLSVYFRDVTERVERERELERYETLLEESTDVNAVLDPDGTFRYLTPSVEHVLGYAREELVGENGFDYVHPDDREAVMREYARMVEDPEYRATAEFRFEAADGSWVVLEAEGRNLLGDPSIEGIVAYTREVTERVERERQIERQRDRLAALNDLNGIVRGITHAAIDATRRGRIEASACDQLVDSDLYSAAWIGEVDAGDRLALREGAVTDGRFEELRSAVAGEGSLPAPVREAVEADEAVVESGLSEGSERDPWYDHALRRGHRSVAAIPIRYEQRPYGVLVVYSGREDAFDGEERRIVGRVGDVVGHAINAVERKEALIADAATEVELRARDVFAPDEVTALPSDARITFDRIVPVGDGSYLGYGRAPPDAEGALAELADGVDHFGALARLGGDENGGTRFEVRLDDPPAISRIASYGGRFRRATIDGREYSMTVEFPPDASIREVVEAVREEYPDLDLVSRRRTAGSDGSRPGVPAAVLEGLTDRQRATLEAAYFAGFFEWPRESTGEEVASSFGISASTFHQHLRAGQRKLLRAVLKGEA